MLAALSATAFGLVLHDLSATKIDGSKLALSDFKGKPVVAVNTGHQ